MKLLYISHLVEYFEMTALITVLGQYILTFYVKQKVFGTAW
jgi:hypothetical protein